MEYAILLVHVTSFVDQVADVQALVDDLMGGSVDDLVQILVLADRKILVHSKTKTT